MKQALVLYWTCTGNTEKVALRVAEGLADGGFAVTCKKLADAEDEDFLAYDLVAFGVPAYNWHVPAPADKYLKAKFAAHLNTVGVKPGAPKNGKRALIFCTYSGPHTGMNEAIPTVKYAGQFFEHMGFEILDEWYILSEFVGSEADSTQGRMGDVRGLPDERELARVRSAAKNLALRA